MGHNANYLSILIAAVGAWIFGGIYYTSLAKYWLAAQGKTVEQHKAEIAARTGIGKATPFVLTFVAEFIMAFVLYGIIFHVGVFTATAGAISGAVCWLGFVLTTVASNNAFGSRRPMLTLIDSGAWLGALVVMGVILGSMGR